MTTISYKKFIYFLHIFHDVIFIYIKTQWHIVTVFSLLCFSRCFSSSCRKWINFQPTLETQFLFLRDKSRCFYLHTRTAVVDVVSPSAGSSQRGPGGGWDGELGEGPGEPGQGSGPQDRRQTQSDRQSSGVHPGQSMWTLESRLSSVVGSCHSLNICVYANETTSLHLTFCGATMWEKHCDTCDVSDSTEMQTLLQRLHSDAAALTVVWKQRRCCHDWLYLTRCVS